VGSFVVRSLSASPWSHPFRAGGLRGRAAGTKKPGVVVVPQVLSPEITTS
jgi:hypothetical protein